MNYIVSVSMDNDPGQLHSDAQKRQWSGAAVLMVAGAIVVFSVGLFLGFAVGAEKGSRNNASADTTGVFRSGGDETLMPVGVNFGPLWKAWHTLNEKYIPASTTEQVSDEDKVWGAIQGLADSLGDPYTIFLPPQDASIFEEDISGNFEGVGMEIGERNGILTVIAPLKGTPADRAGLLSGDQIVRIDDTSTDSLTVDRAVKLIRGPQGTPVVFTIAREGESGFLTIEVVRDVIEIPTIDTEVKVGTAAEGASPTAPQTPEDVFVIRLHNFSAISPGLFRASLREFIESGSTKLILDLRSNPGGFLEASVDMASWFLPTGKVVVTEEFGKERSARVHRSKGYNIFNENLTMVILVNQGSASASEILAGALQEYGIAQLVGERTFGKGSVQELVKITPDTSLKVTVARWLTPQGRSISDGGLEPDVVIEMTAQDVSEGRDPQMDAAIELLSTL